MPHRNQKLKERLHLYHVHKGGWLHQRDFRVPIEPSTIALGPKMEISHYLIDFLTFLQVLIEFYLLGQVLPLVEGLDSINFDLVRGCFQVLTFYTRLPISGAYLNATLRVLSCP